MRLIWEDFDGAGTDEALESIDNTLSLIIPYRMERPPQLLLAVIPPIVALLEVETSIGNHNPYGFRKLFN